MSIWKKSPVEKLVLFLTSLMIMVGGLIPFWFFLVAKYFMKPEGFWPNFTLFGIGMFLAGGLQVILLICALDIVLAIWQD